MAAKNQVSYHLTLVEMTWLAVYTTMAISQSGKLLYGPTWTQSATLTRHPKLVLTACGVKPRLENNLAKDDVSDILGRSSATTTQVRTQLRLTPLSCKMDQR